MPGGLYCCVYGCGNNTKSDRDKSFFSLPTDPKRLAIWLSIIKREDLLETSKRGKLNQRVCSDHFSEENITYVRTLNKDAVPDLHLPEFYSQEEPKASTSSSSLNPAETKESSTQTVKYEPMTSLNQIKEEQPNIKEEEEEEEENFTRTQCTSIVQTPRSLLLTPGKRKFITDLSEANNKIKIENEDSTEPSVAKRS